MKALFFFLGAKELSEKRLARVTRNVRKTSVGAWKKRLSKKQVEEVVAVCGSLLQRLEYSNG